MTFSTEQEIYTMLQNNPSRKRLEAYRAESTELMALVNGQGISTLMDEIKAFERPEMREVRERLTRSVADFYERILGQRNKVFSAKGGSKVYDMPDAQSAQLRFMLNDVRKGMSVEKWIEDVAMRAWDMDPMSLTYMEVNPSTGTPYPTYKSTTDIFDYAFNGRQVEYVAFLLKAEDLAGLKAAGLFSPEPGAKYYRVVDDAKDYIVRQHADGWRIEITFPNPFGRVPGIINSNLYLFTTDSFISSVHKIKELSREYFRDNSTMLIAKMHQMYPREWGVIIECPKCEGTKKYEGDECPVCHGTGQKNTLTVAERIGVPVEVSAESKVPNPPGGYYSPDIACWDAMNNELSKLYNLAYNTYWGTNTAQQTQGMSVTSSGSTPQQTTATNDLLNEQPKHEKFRMFSKWAQSVEIFITDCMGKVVFPKSYRGSTIIYGDRYLLETPDELWRSYETMRTKGAPSPALDSALNDVYEAKFAGNPVQLRKHQLLMYVEPFVHYSVSEVLAFPVPDVVKQSKIYFSEWLQTRSDMEIVTSNEQLLREQLKEYATAYEIPQPEPSTQLQ